MCNQLKGTGWLQETLEFDLTKALDRKKKRA
jgi:hypothetical protein